MTGLIVGGALLGTKIRDFKRADRYVEVKGLVERTVKSDSAVWNLSFKESSDDLKSGYAKTEDDHARLIKFLADQGVSQAEITAQDISVTDRLTRESGDDARKSPRFILTTSITVASAGVDKIAKANAKTASLLEQGIILTTDTTVYKFGGLNALKPDMITEATRNARASADRFAADSGSQVGSIRDANQGVFSISAANAGSSTDDEGGYSVDQQADASIMKKVRVVSTIDYYLVN
jgi:hypothetical protein